MQGLRPLQIRCPAALCHLPPAPARRPRQQALRLLPAETRTLAGQRVTWLSAELPAVAARLARVPGPLPYDPSTANRLPLYFKSLLNDRTAVHAALLGGGGGQVGPK